MRTSALALMLLALTGCNSCNQPLDPDPSPMLPSADGGLVVVLDPDQDPAAVEAPLSASLRATGPSGVAPRHVLIQFNRKVFRIDQIGGEPAGLDFALEPAVEGTLRVAAEDLVEFTPTTGLTPGKTWKASLRSVTEGETVTTPDAPWTTELSAPAFDLIAVRLRSRNTAQSSAVFELVYSGDVNADDSQQRIKVLAGGKPVYVKEITQGEANSVLVDATVQSAITAATKIQLVVDAGMPWLQDAATKAAASTHDIDLPKGPEASIQAVSLREGANGFYIEVVCDDQGAGGGERYWWDRHASNSYWVSSRCMLDDSFIENYVRTDPSTTLSIAPGPAGFRIFGAFGRGALSVSIDAGAVTVDGGVLHRAHTQKFTVPARSPSVSFASKGRYLPTSSWKNLGIQHMNVDTLRLGVRHVPEENLVFWLTGDEPTDERTSNYLLDTALAMRGAPDQRQTSWVPVGDLIPKPKPGVYELNLNANGHTDTARLMLTDMHLVAKASKAGPDDKHIPKVRVWALDVHTGKPKDGVRIRLVRASGKSMGECATSGDRGCEIEVAQDDDPSPPVALIARKDDDLTYIKFSDLELDTPDDTTGIPYTSVLKHQAPLYTDRGVYRPGDTAHVAGVVRTDSFVAPAAGLPVVIKLYDPKGREIKKRVLQSNAGGMVATDFAFGDYQITGHYRATAEIGDIVAGEVAFQVEEFVPERLKVTAAATLPGYLQGEPAPIEVSGEWLFGGAAKNARVELSCSLEASSFVPKGHEGYSFGPAHLSGKPHAITLDTLEGRLDDEGKTTLDCPAPEGGTGSMGPATVVARAAVFEGESGRTTVATARAAVHPSRSYIGLDTSAEKAESGKAFTVSGRVVDWEGKPLATAPELTVEIYRMEEEISWWWEDEGSNQQRQLRPARESRETLAVDSSGTFTLKVTPEEDSAGTMVRVRGVDTLTELFVEGSGRRYWWGDSRQAVDSTPRPMRPVSLGIDVQDRIAVGATVPVKVVAPYAGRMLFTVETDTLLDAVWVDAVAGENEWRFKVDAFAPNVYVSAFLVKDPHLESATAFLPDRAFGVRSVEVIPEKFEQAVTLTVPTEVQPYSPLEVVVDVGKGAGPTFATIAVVDEGILSLTKFEDPDPLGEVFRQRALGVRSFETIGWTLLLAPSGPSSSTGGDGDSAPSRVQMVKPVALWSGVLEADADGKARHTFDMPGYRGQVRVMVVTSSAQRVGTVSKQVLVRDPLVLQTTLPRFLLTGDVAQIPVMVANLSGKDQEVTLKLVAEELQLGAAPDVSDGSPPVPILTFLGEPTGTLSLKPDESKTAVFQVRTRDIPGAAHLMVTASAGALLSKEELDIPIQSASSDVREVKRRALDGGTNDLLADYDGWLDGTDRTTLWVTANPYAQAMTHLRYLVRYPYG